MRGLVPTRTRRLRAAVMSAGVTAVAGSGAVATGWAASRQIRARVLAAPAAETPLGPTARVVASDRERLTLRSERGRVPADLGSDLVVGALGAEGYGQLHGAPARLAGGVEREYRLLSGHPPRVGEEITLDVSAFPDVNSAVGRTGEAIAVPTPVGPIRALHVPGQRDDWAVLVHGRTITPFRELLRMLRPIARRGHPALLVSYRNAVGTHGPGGISRFGADEWADVDAALSLAVARGARSLVIGGVSMGGAIALATASHSPHATLVRGLILDSPVLDLWRAIVAGARTVVPGGAALRRLVVAGAKPVARARFGIDWGALDYLRGADRLQTPVLLFHGGADVLVPVAQSDELAARRPDLVTFVRTPMVDHARSWNAAPERFEQAIDSFLESVLPDGPTTSDGTGAR